MWKAQLLKKSDFLDLFGQKVDFLGNKRTNYRAFFSKRSAIRPRSDKADLLGSTGMKAMPSWRQASATALTFLSWATVRAWPADTEAPTTAALGVG